MSHCAHFLAICVVEPCVCVTSATVRETAVNFNTNLDLRRSRKFLRCDARHGDAVTCR